MKGGTEKCSFFGGCGDFSGRMVEGVQPFRRKNLLTWLEDFGRGFFRELVQT